MGRNSDDLDEKAVFSRRTFFLGAAQLGLLSIVGGRLIYLGGIRSSHYNTLANGNRIKLQVLLPERGRLLDQNGVIMATNQLIYRLLLQPEGRKDLDQIFAKLSTIIDFSKINLQDLRDIRDQHPRHMPIPLKESLSWEEVCRCEMHLGDFPFVTVEKGQRRFYPLSDLMAHVTGYVQMPTEKDDVEPSLVGVADFRLGRIGLERARDKSLRGTAGFREIEVDAHRRVVRTITTQEGVSGNDIKTTLDVDVQRKVHELLGPYHSGALVALDIRTGQIQALVSYPSFNCNLFTEGISHNAWKDLNTNPYNPLNNKVTKGFYAPGSLFKMVIALAGLEHRKITAETEFFCPGYFELNNHRFHCHLRHGHGTVNLERAIQESCDVYFFESCRHIGIDRIEDMSRRFGFGEPTGLILPGEKDGLIPNRSWMRERNKRSWTVADTILTSIGQGALLATPLQLACYMGTLANQGRRMRPLLLTTETPEATSLDLDPKHLALIQKSLFQVVNNPQGTAFRSRIEKPTWEMAGKTGTSQVRRISKKERDTKVLRNDEVEWQQRDHALFGGYAPFHDPKYACVVLIEHGGSGSRVAAPIARDILTLLLERDRHAGKT